MEPIGQFILHHLSAMQGALRRHPRRVSGVLLAVLGGFTAAAFGIAPLAPDADELPRRMIEETVDVHDLERQVDQLAVHEIDLWRSEVTRSTDTADSLMRRLSISDPIAAAFLRSDRLARRLIEGRGGKMVQARTAADGTLLELVGRFPASDEARSTTHFTRLTVARDAGGFSSRIETAPYEVQVRMAGGTIRSSLFAATDEVGLPDSIAIQMVDIFSTDIDFHRELRKGDRFSIAYESLVADGQPVVWNEGAGRVLAAEFVNGRRQSQAFWFVDPASGKGAYFGPDGQSKRRGFLASPLAFSRVTSGFAMRLHPIFQTWRAHNGIDYAAPKGTPVFAVGDGVVARAGRQNGYGNVVTITHSGSKSTVYAHLSQISVRTGQRVSQGQTIGLVGATGWATGPHLHFEFRVDGQMRDPRAMARQTETVAIDSGSRERFQLLATTAQAQLIAAESLIGTRVTSE